MYSHIMVGANDIEKSKAFYDSILGTLGYGPGVTDEKGRVFWMDKSGIFSISKPIDGEPACNGNGSTIGFAVKDTETGDKWHAAGLSSGGTACEEPPGLRESANGKIYLAYLRDPAGNKICVVNRLG
ncbi:MAG TPA: glyoxalase [Gammaproteobacteria bacterium]|nr:glyoxalase [Gammaproteobacteria bacterium]|tara:strand:+ start:530 stop:910 length:381 start_codon:yes stop_codon:yes gene_type:complete